MMLLSPSLFFHFFHFSLPSLVSFPPVSSAKRAFAIFVRLSLQLWLAASVTKRFGQK
jgi:hypothetical protein